MAKSIKTKFNSIEKNRISKEAQQVLADIQEVTDNFKKVSPVMRKEFNSFYDRLLEQKPESIKGTKEYKEFDKSQPTKPTPEITKRLLRAIKRAKKLRKAQGLSTSDSDIMRDAARPALKAGKRVSKNGNVYYEYRENRSDRNPKGYPKLEDGGEVSSNIYEQYTVEDHRSTI